MYKIIDTWKFKLYTWYKGENIVYLYGLSASFPPEVKC